MSKKAARGTSKRTQESPKEQSDELGGSLRRSARLQLQPTSSPGSPQLRSNPASFTKKPKIQGHAKSPWGFPELFPRSSTKPVLTPCTLGLHSSKMLEKPSIVTHQDAAASEPADEEGSSSSNLSPGKRNQAIIDDIIASVMNES
ncbi:unnamed protein product [Linum trigynum]|uniref:Uncharacterized protein n=1 Tax=Linum trigynum TaxID=586398 RepID=A0AAV2CXV5_9ROSI